MAASISVQREASSRYAHPFTIVIVANPTLESPLGVGHYETDPVISDRPKFDLACQYIEDCLFGGLPNQAERLLSDPSVSEGIRILTVFEENAPPHDSNALVSENVAGQLVEPRAPKMRNYIAAVNLSADIIYAVTASRRYARASAYFTSDDQTRGGI